jgi:uncharacterized protein YkwD
MLALLGPGGAKAGQVAAARKAAGARAPAIVAAVNAFRSAHHLSGLRVDLRLARAARAHSLDMMQRRYFAHGNLLARMNRFRVRGSLFEENLAWSSGVPAAQGVVADWLASPPHRETLLDPELRRIGVGAPVGSFGGYATATVVTADFAG